jgi:arylsulfatase A-like enzyme
MKSKKLFIPILFFILAVIAGFRFTTSETIEIEAKKTNIILLTVDDLKPVLGCYGDTIIHTPNIDRLAQGGTVMLANYCQQAVCAPSRVSMFTGMRPDYTGVRDLRTNMRDVRPGIVTLPEYFKSNGYKTVGYGKLLHGARNEDPQSWSEFIHDADLKYADGFDVPAHLMYQSEAAHKAFNEAKEKKLNWRETNRYMKEQGVRPATEALDVPDDAYADGAFTSAALDRMEESVKNNEPLFLALGYHKPHLPFVAPKKFWDLYDREEITLAAYQQKAQNSPGYAYHNGMELRNYSDVPLKGAIEEDKQRELIHGYYASVSYIDAQIGKVLDKIEELGIGNNTIIVLWGDHGWHLGDHGLWCKHTNFEQATAAPLIVSAPGFKGGQSTVSMTEFVDIFPTICDLANVAIPENLDGASLVPLMINPEIKVKDFSISQYPRGEHMGYSMRNNQYRLTIWMKKETLNTDSFQASLVKSVELYDYKSDPEERVSLASDPSYKATVDKMTDSFIDWYNEYKLKLKQLE